MVKQLVSRAVRGLGVFLIATALAPGVPVAVLGDDTEPAGPIISLSGQTGVVTCIAFSPDGKFAATHGGLGDHSFHFWDVEKRKRLYKVESPECEGYSVLWAAGGKGIVSAGAGGPGGGVVLLREPETGKLVGKPLSHDGPVRRVVLAPDGKRIAAADIAGKVRVWDFQSGEKVREFDHGKGVSGVAFSPDGRYLLTGGDDKVLRLWNVEKDRQERMFEGHTSPVGCVGFLADGSRLYSASSAPLGDTDNTIRVWDAKTGKEIAKLKVGGEGKDLTAAALSPDGRRALTGHSNGEVRLWDLDAKKEIKGFHSHKHPVSSVAFSPDGRHALSGEDWQTDSLLWLYRLPRQ